MIDKILQMVYSLPWDRLLNSGSCINYGFSWQSQKPPQWFTILGRKWVVIKQFWIGCCWFATWGKAGWSDICPQTPWAKMSKEVARVNHGYPESGLSNLPLSTGLCSLVHLHSHISQPFNQGPSSIHLAPAFPTMRCVPGATTSRAWEEVWHPRGRHQRAHGQLGQGYAVRVLRSATEGVGLASWNGHGAWWILVGPQHQLNRYVGHDLIQVVNDMTIPTFGCRIHFLTYLYIYICIYICIYVYMYIMCT